MAKEKACVDCKIIFEGSKCPNCGGSAVTENFKGRVHVFNEKSKIAKNMKVFGKGEFAIKTR